MTDLKEQGEDHLLNTIIGVREAIDSYHYLPFLISQNTDVQELLLYPVLDKGADVSRFLEQMNLVSGATTLMVLDLDGRALSYSRWREEQSFFLSSHAHKPYFIKAREGDQGVFFERHASGGKVAIYLSAPIYHASRFMGVAVVRIDLDTLSSKLNQLEDFLLFAEDGEVMLAADPRWLNHSLAQRIDQNVTRQLRDGSQIQLSTLNDGQQILFQSVALPDLGWHVAVTSDIRPVIVRRNTATFVSLGGCLTFGLLLLYVRERQQKKRSKQAMRDVLELNERQQRDIINNAHVGMLALDDQAQIRFINPTACQLFGVGSERILGFKMQSLLAGSDDQFGPLQRTLSRIGSPGFAPLTAHEAVGKRADGSAFPMMMSVKQMRSQAEMQYLVTVIDISKRKRLERALQQANDQLETKVQARTQALQEAQQELVQAEKMAALGRMSSAVVHELNQPLTAMRTYVAICRHLLEGDRQMLADNLDLIDDLTQRMALITQQLKTFAFKKPESLTPVKPSMALDQALMLCRERIEQEDIQVTVINPVPDATVFGDSPRLEQVFVNLVSNACDALAANQTQHSKDLVVEVEYQTDSAQPSLKICVSDNGPGIEHEHLQQLFDPFFTTKSIGNGLGLGLSIVNSIVKDLGGTLSVENRVEGGARFTVILPRCSESPVCDGE